MKQTIKQIKDLATATDNIYLWDIINKLENEIEDEIIKQKIEFINKLVDLPF